MPKVIPSRDCAECGRPLQRDRIVAGCVCCSWDCANAQKRRTAVAVFCACCGKELDKSQRKRAKQRGDTFCSAACRRVAGGTPVCARCGHPLTKQQIRGRRLHCSQTCTLAARTDRAAARAQATPESAPTPVAPQEPAQQATGRVLGREPRGGAHYELGTVNGHLMVFEVWQGRRALYCAYSAWEGSQAWRRCHTPQPVVLPMGAEPVTAWGRRRQGEEVTE